MTGIGLKTQEPGGIHKPRIIFLIIAIFVLVTKKRTYPGDSFPSPGDLVLTPLVYATVNPMRAILGQKKGRGTLYHLSLWYLREPQVRKLQGKYSVKSLYYFRFELGELKLYRIALVAVDS